MASASSAAEFRARATHLVVFQHGLWGNEKDFRAFEALFTQYFPQDEVYPYIATSNATSLSSVFQTYDGIDTGGTRLADEIETVAKQMPRLSKFSILGHSLGGLYARYCCGVLFARGFFEDVEPMNFVTLATPHLGIRRSQPTIMNAIHNSITPNLFDLTGQQFALKDRATTQTIALSHSVRRYPHRRPQVVYSEIEDMLLVQLPHAQVHPATTTRAEAKTFEVVECMLREGALLMYRKTERIPVVPEETSLRDEGEHASSTPETDNEASGEDEEEHGGMSDSESASQEAGATQVERIAEIDLLHAHVTVVVPEKDVSRRRRRRRHRTLGRRASAMPQNEDGSFWDIEITVDAPVDSSDGTEEDARATGTKATYTIRLPYDELPSKWKWVVALSNASHGLYCRSQSLLETTKDALASVSAPSVLSCLTRGQFIQALQLFRNRSVYASIFNDMQVPYSCGAIRAFNPYRTELDSSEATRSPYYHHIVMRSIYNAPLLRDTLPEDVKDRAERDSPPSSDLGTRFSLVKMLSERTTSRRRHSSAASHQQSFSTFFSNLTGSHSGQTRASLATSTVPPPVSSSASSRVQESGNRSASSHSFPVATTTATTSAEVDTDSDSNHSLENALADGKRMAPFEDGSLLLDHADLAFSNDELRDTLRGMMLSLQSVGWRRIDVHFHSPLAHMKIIAMTANPSKPMTKGLDVVHHVMDTFLL